MILAGISISALTNQGLFGRAKDSKEETIKAQLKEEIEMTIQEIQVEEIPKGNSVTLESLAKGQLASKLTGITAELDSNEIIGEYKNYDYTIYSNFKVEIGGKLTGAKPEGIAEILTTNYIFEGEGTVQIKVTASIAEGTIERIDKPSEATLVTDTSATEKIYTVAKNGIYVFKIVGDNGRKTNVTANVENILSAPQIKVDTIKADSFKISVETNYPEGAITEFRYSVDGAIKSQGTTDKNYTVTGLVEDTEYSNIKVLAYINNSSTYKESNIETVKTITSIIQYSWEELAEIAKAISNDSTITNDTEEAQVTINGEIKTLRVGDKKDLDGKQVRILGFNHDTLTSETAYGETTATRKAGISFEYVDLLTSASMNSSSTNSGGWGSCALRSTLNGTTYNSLSIKDKIKKVQKDYTPTYNSASTTKSSDYLWLLSCGEIWDNGYKGGETRAYAIATEGSQYKYYQLNLGSTAYNSNTDITKKPNTSNADWWWLRSPYYYLSSYFCTVLASGGCNYADAISSRGVAPGFSI